MNRTLVFVALVVLFFSSCRQIDLFEKNTIIPSQKWKQGFAATGSFNVADTTSLYSIFIVLRHTDLYNYNNIWLNVGLQAPGDSMKYQRVDLQLGTDATGWHGTGMNDIWEVRKPINERPQRFLKSGTYHFSIQQIMRDDPLEHILSAGMRLERQ